MIIHTLEPIVREHPFCKDLPERYVALITGCAKNVRFDPDSIVFREGEAANEFYLIREGLVGVEVTIPQRGATLVQTVGTGDVLGWSWLFPPYHWHFDARALEATRALALDGKCLRDKCREDHSLGYEFLLRFSQIVTERLEATRLQLLDLYGKHA
jgi:CRP-like cAMP-binding protein